MPLLLGGVEEKGVGPAVLAAPMETEGSAENGVSPAGAAGLMQLMPDKFRADDDPFDAGTYLQRAGQLVRRILVGWNGDRAVVAVAYFGAVDNSGHVTDDSDGAVTGVEHVTIFAQAYERWSTALGKPAQRIVTRPLIRRRNLESPGLALRPAKGPERDRWYLPGKALAPAARGDLL